MSAPNTNIEKQARHHRGPLIGMAVAVLFGVLMIVYWLFEESAQSDPPASQDAVESVPSNAPVEMITPRPNSNPSAPQGVIEADPAPQDRVPEPENPNDGALPTPPAQTAP